MNNQQSFLNAGHPDADLLESLAAESYHCYQLENGLTVLFRPDQSLALCSAQGWIKTRSWIRNPVLDQDPCLDQESKGGSRSVLGSGIQ